MSSRFSDFKTWLGRFLSPWTIVCLAVVAFVMFYGDNSVFDSIDQDRTVDSLRAELAAIRDSTEHYRRLNERLTSDPELMEQVVREQYGMKRPHEDVYNFVESTDNR
ncbi:MAG: septum formation initiator family protein [Muribaculaceae bacterium]|nr:septum formation initiator family protein [Muribaculaceae bacterium]